MTTTNKNDLIKITNFIATYKNEIKHVQDYKGERYSEALKLEVAKLCKLSTVSRNTLSKEIGIHATLCRNWDFKYNHNINVARTIKLDVSDEIIESLESLTKIKIQTLLQEDAKIKKALKEEKVNKLKDQIAALSA